MYCFAFQRTISVCGIDPLIIQKESYSTTQLNKDEKRREGGRKDHMQFLYQLQASTSNMIDSNSGGYRSREKVKQVSCLKRPGD